MPENDLDIQASDISSVQNNPAKKKRISSGWIVFLTVCLFTLVVFLGFFRFFPPTVSNSVSRKLNSVETVSPTPMPFRELTIPYLREREYTSSFEEETLLSENESYTTYLTEYTSDGLRINALLTKPRDEIPEGGWPAIIFVHGYIPPSTYETNGQAYSSYVDYLARNGFVVLKIDLRGHGESEGEAGGGYYGSDYVIDTLNAYAALQNTAFVNPRKIGMWGHSMAGNILMRSFAAKPTIPAIVIWAGAVYSYTDMQKYGIQDTSYRPPMPTTNTRSQNMRRKMFETYGSPSATSPFWKQVAPINYLDDLKGAIQIHHAVDDSVVNIGYSRDLVTLLNETQVEHEFYEYTSGGHNISGENFTIAMDRTVDFYKAYLQ